MGIASDVSRGGNERDWRRAPCCMFGRVRAQYLTVAQRRRIARGPPGAVDRGEGEEG